MRALKEVQGQLLTDPDITVIIHQCKTINKFDFGLAAQIRSLYPAAWEADCEASRRGTNVLGSYSWAKVSENKFIFNVYSYSTKDVQKRFTDYVALKNGLYAVKLQLVHFMGSPSVGMGRIGCRYGNGDWNVVRDIIREVFNDYEGEVKIIDNPGA